MDTVYQAVLDKIIGVLPDGWNRLAIYFARVNKMMDFKYYVDCGNGYVDCLSMPDYDRLAFVKLTVAIDKLLVAERDKLPKKQQWSVFTMFVNSLGKFEVNYSYDNISKTFIQYQEDWENKYIYCR